MHVSILITKLEGSTHGKLFMFKVLKFHVIVAVLVLELDELSECNTDYLDSRTL